MFTFLFFPRNGSQFTGRGRGFSVWSISVSPLRDTTGGLCGLLLSINNKSSGRWVRIPEVESAIYLHVTHFLVGT